MDTRKDYPPPPCVSELEVDSGGFSVSRPRAVQEYLTQDLPGADSLVLAASQQPIRASALLDRVEAAAWRTRPSWYVVADEDRRISPARARIALRDQVYDLIQQRCPETSLQAADIASSLGISKRTLNRALAACGENCRDGC